MDDMNVETLGNAHVDLLQEVQELRSSMTLVAFADHKAGSDIEGCEQRRCGHKSESGAPGRPASSAGQAARDQGLVSGSFRQRSDHRPIGRRQIKTDDVADFVDEQRVAGKLERLRAMRLQAESVPYPSDRRVRIAGRRRHRADRPVRGVLWRGPQRALDYGGDLIIINCPRSAWTGLIQEPFGAVLQEAAAPPAVRVLMDDQLARN